MAKHSPKLPRIAGLQGRSGAAAVSRPSATIAIYSVKGGVGKTTLAANLAWCAAAMSGHRTLLWDLDAAGGSGFLYGIAPDKSRRAETIFSHQRDPEGLIRPTGFEGLDILPSDESIRELGNQFVSIGKRKRLAKLTGRLAANYRRIILDCPPVMNEVSAQAVRAADLVIVPLPPSPLSARALELVVQEVTANGKGHPPILPVLSMLDMRRSLHRQSREEHPDWPAIPHASAVEQCAVRQRPVGEFAPQCAAARSFAMLWSAIERKLAG